ncbi:hypothetical protein QJQ45_020992, partial [Haematococcus lacustris]
TDIYVTLRDQPVRGLMWCPVVPPRKPPQAPGSSQAATQPAASEPGSSTPPELCAVIKVPEGAVLRGCKKTRRKLREHLQLRAEIHSQLRVIASLFALRIFLTCLVGYPTPGYRSATQPPAVQPPQAPDAPHLPPLPPRAPAQPAPAQPASMECDIDSDSESDCGSEPEPQSDSEQLKDFCKFFANPNFKTYCNRTAIQHRHPMLMPAFDDPSNQVLLAKLQDLGSINRAEHFVKLYAKAARAQLGWSGEEAQLFIKMACGYGINAKSSELKAATLDKGHVADLIEEANKHRRLLGMKKQGSLQDTLPLPCRMRHAVHVCRWLEQWQQPTPPLCQGNQSAARGVEESREKAFPDQPPCCTWSSALTPGPPLGQVAGNIQRIGESMQHPLEMCSWMGLKTIPALAHRVMAKKKRKSTDKHKKGPGKEIERSSRSRVAPGSGAPGQKAKRKLQAHLQHRAEVHSQLRVIASLGKGIAEQCEFVFDPATHIGVGIGPGRHPGSQRSLRYPESGQLVADQLARWKLTKGQVKHASGLINARRDTQRWLAPIQPNLQHLAAASSAGTSLEENLKHITTTLATWDAVWEVHLDPKWAGQRLRLYGAQDRALEQFFKQLEEDMAEVSMERHGRAKQLVVFFGAASIGTRGGWGADVVLRACCKVVCRPRGTDQLRGRVVPVDEHRTTRASSALNGQQPCEEELDHEQPTRPADWQPPAGQVDLRLLRSAWSQQRDQPAAEPTQPTKGKGKAQGKAQGKAAKAKPAPQPGRWLNRDCNAALNMQCIGESRWRPLELCWWPDQAALPAKCKEHPGLGYKRLQDKPTKAQQQQPPAVAQ